MNYFACLLSVVVCTGCTQLQTKQESFPSMYSDAQPLSVLVVPAINESTAADAGDYLNVTIAQPFANQGYYVLPIPIVAEIFKREGLVDGQQALSFPVELYRTNFGADAVLFLTIKEWDKNYFVLGGNVTVALEYVLISTQTAAVIWSYSGQVVVNTSGQSRSGNPLADLIGNLVSTALTTATTKYVSVAAQVHEAVLLTMPYGKYHPKQKADGDMRTVDPEKLKVSLD